MYWKVLRQFSVMRGREPLALQSEYPLRLAEGQRPRIVPLTFAVPRHGVSSHRNGVWSGNLSRPCGARSMSRAPSRSARPTTKTPRPRSGGPSTCTPSTSAIAYHAARRSAVTPVTASRNRDTQRIRPQTRQKSPASRGTAGGSLFGSTGGTRETSLARGWTPARLRSAHLRGVDSFSGIPIA